MNPEREQFDFSKALALLKEGAKVQRSGWNKETYVYGQRTLEINHLNHINIRTEGPKIVAWQPTQVDLFANDWQLA